MFEEIETKQEIHSTAKISRDIHYLSNILLWLVFQDFNYLSRKQRNVFHICAVVQNDH